MGVCVCLRRKGEAVRGSGGDLSRKQSGQALCGAAGGSRGGGVCVRAWLAACVCVFECMEAPLIVHVCLFFSFFFFFPEQAVQRAPSSACKCVRIWLLHLCMRGHVR